MTNEELIAHLDKCDRELEQRLRQMGRPVLKGHETSKSYRRGSKKDCDWMKQQTK